MGNKKTLKVFSTASVAGMIATAVLSSQAFAAVDAYSVKVGEDVYQYSKQEIAKSFIEAKRGNDAALYNDFAAKLEKAGGFFAFHDDKTGYVDFDSIKGKFVEAKREGAEFKVDEFTESSDAKVVEVPTVKKAVVDEDGKVKYEDEENSGEEAGIKSVTSLNMKQIKVEFTSKITDSQKKDDVEDVDNYELRNEDGDKIEETLNKDITFEKAELDENGKFVVLTISDAVMANQTIEVKGSTNKIKNDDDDNYVNNQSKYTLVIDENITDKDDVEKEFELKDTDLPEVVSAEVVGKDTIKVKFTEPIAPEKITVDKEGNEKVALLNDDTFEINDDDVAVDEVRLCDNHKEANIILASDLKDGEKVKINVKSKAQDYAGYALMKDELNIEAKENKEKLEIVGYKDTDNRKVTLIFNKDIKFGDDSDDDYVVTDSDDDFLENFYHTNGKNKATSATIDGNELKLTFEDKLSGTVYVNVDADSVQDLWEVKNDDLSKKVDVNLDTTRPEVKSVEQGDKDTEIKVKFSEEVKEKEDYSDSDDKDAAGDEKDNYTIKDEDGKEVKISSVSLNSDGKEATLKLRDSLDSGDKYTVEVEDVEDTADNKIKSASIKFTATGAAVEAKDINVSAYNQGKNDQKIVVDFDTEMKTGDAVDSIENLNNYTLQLVKGGSVVNSINLSDYHKAKAKAIEDNHKIELTIPGDDSDSEDQYNLKKGEMSAENRDVKKDANITAQLVIARVADSEDNKIDEIAYAPKAVDDSSAVLLNDDDDNLVATAPDTIIATWGDELDFDKDDVSIVAVNDDDEVQATLKASKTDIKKKNGVTTVTYTLDDDYKGNDDYKLGNNELNYDGTITIDGTPYAVAIKTKTETETDKIESKNEYDAKLVGNKVFRVDDNIAPSIAKLADKDGKTMADNKDAYDDRSDYDDDVRVVEFNRNTKSAKLELTFEEDIAEESLSRRAFVTTDDDITVTSVSIPDSSKKNVVEVILDLTKYEIKDNDTAESILDQLGIKSDNQISDAAGTYNYNNGRANGLAKKATDETDYNYTNDLDLEINFAPTFTTVSEATEDADKTELTLPNDTSDYYVQAGTYYEYSAQVGDKVADLHTGYTKIPSVDSHNKAIVDATKDQNIAIVQVGNGKVVAVSNVKAVAKEVTVVAANATATSKTISGFDFSTVAAKNATATSEAISDFDFSSANKAFTIKVGSKTATVELNSALTNVAGVVSKINQALTTATITDFTATASETDKVVLTSSATAEVSDKFTIGGADATDFFAKTTYTGADADTSANKAFTIKVGSKTATVELNSALTNVAGVVSKINQALTTATITDFTATASGTDKVVLTSSATAGASDTFTIGGADASDFFAETTYAGADAK